MLEELVNNKKYLVKLDFGPWKILDKPIKLALGQKLQIKLNCPHKNQYHDLGINYREDYCEDCGESVMITSFRD